MPPLPAVPGVVSVKHGFDVGTDLSVQTRWHMSYTGGPPSNADCAAFAAAMYTSAATEFAPLLGLDSSLQSIEVTDLSSSSGGSGTHVTGTAGTRGGAVLAAGTCVLCHQPIARRYRGGKPRTYWPFFTAADLLSPQAWESSSVTAALGALETYLGAIEVLFEGTTQLHSLVSVSYYEGFTAVTNPITGRTKDVAKLRVGGPVVDVVTSLGIAPQPRSQRRRNG